MNAIILAAGKGTRLGNITRNYPKAIVKVMDKELIRYVVDMVLYVNASKIVVVGGSGFNHLKSFISSYAPEVILTRNLDYEKGNLYSLKCALPYVNDSFLLFNVDHVFSRDLLDVVISVYNNSNEITLFCDNLKTIEDDQMKVSAEGNRLCKISKTLETYDTGYCGLIYCPKAMIDNFIRATNEISKKKGADAVTEDILNHLISKNQFISIVDIDGYQWFEVDTLEDLYKAELLVSDFPDKWV
tara:strand:- start:182 stop:910 length:729 start_codon:yes stop_codon:yes gene_type:complete